MNVTLLGRIPSWLLLSSHSFLTSNVTVSVVYVFSILNPSATLPDGDPIVYPGICFNSRTVYAIADPFSFLYSSFDDPVQFGPVNVIVSTFSSPLNTPTSILFGLTPSWLSLSFHIFSTLIFIVSGSCTLFIAYTSDEPDADGPILYPSGTLSSLTSYSIICLFLYFGNALDSPVHLPFSCFVTSIVPTDWDGLLLSYMLNVTLFGLIPSLSLSSDQVFEACNTTVSGLFVIINPSIWFPVVLSLR